MVLTLIFCIAIFEFENFACYGNVYNGYRVYEVPLLTNKMSELNYIRSLGNPSVQDIEILHHNLHRGIAQVLVSPSKRREFLNTLKKKKLKSKVIVQDFGRLIQPFYQLRMENVNLNGEIDFDHYMTFEEIDDFIKQTAERFLNKMRIETIGNSIEGENISIVIITENIRRMQNKPVIFVEAGIHSREWVSVSTGVYFIDQLAKTSTYTKDVEWRIIPIANPDGYKYSFANANNRLWRKNRRIFPNTHCEGVDLNRNFAFYWGTAGSSFNKCSDTYVGEGPFSEPESRAIRDAIFQVQHRAKVYVSFHSFGQFILHPPSVAGVNIPHHQQQRLINLGLDMAMAIFNEYFMRYVVASPIEVFYPAPGSSVDFSFFNAGIHLSYAFELRDTGEQGFVLSEEQILPTAEEIFAAVLVLYDDILRVGNMVPRQESISDDELNPATKELEMSSRPSIFPRQESISDDELQPETNAANELAIPFSFVHSVLTSLLNDWLSYLSDNDVNK